MSVLFLVLFGIMATNSVTVATNPGIKARISENGLQYAANVATKILSTQVKTLHIPDQSGTKDLDVGHVEYTISNIRVTSFTPPQTKVTTQPFKWTLTGTSTALTADWRYKYRVGFIKFSDSGSLDVSLQLNIEATAVLGVDSTGRPTIHSESCSTDVTDVDVHFHGGASWLYNLFAGKVEDAIRSSLQGQICTEVKNVINNNAEAELATMPITIDIQDNIVLDYSLVSAPVFTSSYIDVPFKGEFFWKTDKQEYPLAPKVIPTTANDTRMVNFWLTQYSVNSLAYTEYKHGALVYNLTKSDLPSSDQYILDTTCESFLKPCIGGIIPKVGQMYPHASVFLDMTVTEAPEVHASPTGVTGNWTGLIQYFVAPHNSSAKFLFSTNTRVTFNLDVAIKGLNITANINNFQVNMVLEKSAIGAVDVTALNAVMDLALKSFIIPKLNVLCNEGMPLPAIKDVQYINPTLCLLENSVYVGADLKYTGE